jgi:predicted phage-related endonuclease
MSMLLLTPDNVLIPQGTEEWKLQRLGKLTASRFSDAIAKTKTGWGASRSRYMADLAIERFTGKPVEHYQNAAMLQGTERQPAATAAYEWESNVTVEQVGFIEHPRIKMAGCSPDGFVGDNGLIEIKSPMSHTHLETLLTQNIDGGYISQMMFQLSVTGRQWCDFVSFDPAWPPEMQLYVRRIERDDRLISILEKQAVEFLAELDEKITLLHKLYPAKI